MVPLSQKPRNHRRSPTVDPIRSGPWLLCGVPLRQHSREPCGRPPGTVANLRARTRHPPHIDSRFDVSNIRIGSFPAEPHALHLLADLVHVESEPQFPRDDRIGHAESLRRERVRWRQHLRGTAALVAPNPCRRRRASRDRVIYTARLDDQHTMVSVFVFTYFANLGATAQASRAIPMPGGRRPPRRPGRPPTDRLRK